MQVNEDFLAQYHNSYGIKYDFGEKEGQSTSKKKTEDLKDERKHKLVDKEKQGECFSPILIPLFLLDSCVFSADLLPFE